MDPTYPLVPIANFLGFFLVLISLSSKILASWNVGVFMFSAWISLVGIVIGVNTTVWADNVRNVAPVWCDITTHIIVGSSIGIPACSFVITRRLYKIISLPDTSVSNNVISPIDPSTRTSYKLNDLQKRKESIIDFFLCLGLPIVLMAVFYTIQDTRFVILEEFGCLDNFAASWVSLVLYNGPPIILPTASILFYCPRILWTFYNQQKEISELLNSYEGINRNSYYRMLALGCLDILVTLPVHVITFVADSRQDNVVFWPGWSEIHSDWAPVLLTTSEWSTSRWTVWAVKWSEWINPFYALVFFSLFGLTEEARSRYTRVFWIIVKPLGYKQTFKPEASNVIFAPMNFGPARTGETGSSGNGRRSFTASGTFDNPKPFDVLCHTEEGQVEISMEKSPDMVSLASDAGAESATGSAARKACTDDEDLDALTFAEAGQVSVTAGTRTLAVSFIGGERALDNEGSDEVEEK